MFSEQTIVKRTRAARQDPTQKRAAMKRTVKAMLVQKGITQKEIADELEVTPGAVSQVVNGQYSSRRIKEHIAKRLGLPYEKVWGKPDG